MNPGRTDLPDDLNADELAQLLSVADRLDAERPSPRAVFRGDLRRSLVAASAGVRPRPRRLRALVAAYATSGALLLAVAALGLADTGPLAPQNEEPAKAPLALNSQPR